MIRNETHNVTLYSSLNSTLPDDIRQYNWSSINYILNHKQGSMQEIQDAIWYFVPDYVTPSINETNTWSMINAAKVNSNYIPSKGDIMAIIAFAAHPLGTSTSGSGVQNTILEYRIP